MQTDRGLVQEVADLPQEPGFIGGVALLQYVQHRIFQDRPSLPTGLVIQMNLFCLLPGETSQPVIDDGRRVFTHRAALIIVPAKTKSGGR